MSAVFENLEVGASIEEIMEWFDVSHEQIAAVLTFAARSLEAPLPDGRRSTAAADLVRRMDVMVASVKPDTTTAEIDAALDDALVTVRPQCSK